MENTDSLNTKKKNKKGLTNKQEKFCDEYMIDLNATQAAMRAGYSNKTANEQGAQLLAKLSIKARIQELSNKIAVKTEITQEEVIESLKTARTGAEEAKQFSAAIRATELLGKHLGMFTDRIKVDNELTIHVIKRYALPEEDRQGIKDNDQAMIAADLSD